jgi:hypothetical protein
LLKQEIRVSTKSDIIEGSENDSVIVVELENGVFNEDIAMYRDYYIRNLPNGVSMGSVSRISDSKLEIKLSGNSAVDYDEDITDIEVYIYKNAVKNPNFDEFSLKGAITFKAVVEPNEPSLSISKSELNESVADDGSVADFQTVTISNGVFSADVERFAEVSNLYPMLNSRMTRISETELKVELIGNSMFHGPMDSSRLTVIIRNGGIDGVTKDLATSSFNIKFIGEPRLEISAQSEIAEGQEHGKKITMKLSNAGSDRVTKDSVQLVNAPTGVSIGSIEPNLPNEWIIVLEGNATVDYDSDLNVGVTLDSEAIYGSDSDLTSNAGVSFKARDEQIAVDRIKVIVDANDLSALVEQDLIDAGVKQYSLANLAEYKSYLAGLSGTDVDTDVKLQQVILDIDAVLSAYNGITTNTEFLNGNETFDKVKSDLKSPLTINGVAFEIYGVEYGDNLTNSGAITRPSYNIGDRRCGMMVRFTKGLIKKQIDIYTTILKKDFSLNMPSVADHTFNLTGDGYTIGSGADIDVVNVDMDSILADIQNSLTVDGISYTVEWKSGRFEIVQGAGSVTDGASSVKTIDIIKDGKTVHLYLNINATIGNASPEYTISEVAK